MPLDSYLTVDEIARLMGMDAATVRGYIAPSSRLEPKLPVAQKLGPRLNLIAVADFEAWKTAYTERQQERQRKVDANKQKRNRK